MKHPAPDFSFPVWNGTPHEQVHLSQWQGHVVVVNFWASWCEACRLEAADLVATWRKYKSQGVMFAGVAVQDTQGDGTAFLRRYGVTYPSGPDGTGSIAQTYRVTNVGVPETVIINRQGIVVSQYIGAMDQQTLGQAITKAGTSEIHSFLLTVF
jgi:cytochrome c biogenesis protein CcmG/thiol:disulfide interchange protein DsbE